MVLFWYIILIIAILLPQSSNSANTLDAEEESCKGQKGDKATTDSIYVEGGMLFENLKNFSRPETSSEELNTFLKECIKITI